MDAHNVMKLGVALEVLCLDCTRYDASDNLAKGLAIISLIPYLAIFHTASVSSAAATLLLQLYVSQETDAMILSHMDVLQKACMLLYRLSTAEGNCMM